MHLDLGGLQREIAFRNSRLAFVLRELQNAVRGREACMASLCVHLGMPTGPDDTWFH